MSLVFQASRIPFTGFGNSRFPCEFFGRTHRPSSIGIQISLKTTAPPVADAVVLGLFRSRCRHLRNGNSRFAPAAPLAGALLICISAVSVSCCAHLSAPDVWQIAFLGSAASPLVTLRGCACCRCANRRRLVVKALCRWPARWPAHPCRVFVGMGAL